ncbi:Tc toxin subunit A [Yokenella regensburgei]|uniref:Tc toxin subunit A n=1 Tax=Yokenella regensburgei TaxID=158877 RepID=UPI0031D56F7B
MVENTSIPGLSLSLDNITIKAITDAGYRNIIDIISENETHFVQKLASVELEQAKKIYKKASDKMAELLHIYRALQARRNPLVQQISKFGVSTQPEGLMNALERSLNNGPDYEHLFPVRDEFYAPEDSIQSLFSPGRYLTELYSISRGLHASDSVLNIDKRLPDMASLPLSQISMDTVIPALTILNSITNISDSLNTTSWPMTLPYDDNLAQIRCALPVFAASLQGVWSALSDAQWQSFAPIAFVPPVPADDRTPSPATREELGFMPGAYKLLTSAAATAEEIKTRYHLDTINIATELRSIDTFTNSTALSFNQLLEMTGQEDYQTTVAAELPISRYYAYSDIPAEIVSVPVTTYGQTYLSSVDGTATNDIPMLVVPDATPETYKLDFTNDGVATRLADKAERLLRLQRQMNLEYAELDWLIKNINQAITRTSNWKLDTTVLDALAVFSRLSSYYAISADGFACFIGTMNTYGSAEQKSLFERLFTSPVTQQVAKLSGDVDFSLQTASYDAALICGGLGVTANELFEMSQLAFGAATVVKMSASKYAQLYRLAIIPRMLGISFTEARTLWLLLDPNRDMTTVIAAAVPTLEILDIIIQTESVLGWMESCQLEVTDIVGLLSANYPAEPTPEVFNFLNTLHSTLSQEGLTPADPSFRDMMCRFIGSTFQIKSNVMPLLIDWQDLWFKNITGTSYTLTSFWTEIADTFLSDGVTIDDLYSTPDMVRYSYGLAQYAAIATTFSLTEQDLQLLVTHPEWFFDGHSAETDTPRQSFSVLLLLSRFKAWQQRVVTATEDALGYFSWVNQATAPTTAEALNKLAQIHNWDVATTTAMNTALVSNAVYGTHPVNFLELNRLETWMRAGEQLNTSTTCIDQLSTLSRPESSAGDESLNLSNVASALMAGTMRPSED